MAGEGGRGEEHVWMPHGERRCRRREMCIQVGTQYSEVFFMIRRNSSSLISPSPSRSASSIISCSSSSVMFSPSSFATRLRLRKEIFPVSSSSNKRKALRISSRESFSLIFAVIISRNSEKSMVPEPSLSMSEIIFLISSFFGSKPRARMATLSSLASMVPEPSVSNRSKASRISCFCSSVSSNFLLLAAPERPPARPRCA
mmetsp:Transcript_22680/g.66035  ORF Transcript_22680/g.66035 Transcript_22680/m.66035 type:complete len:201 (+) Transcript_22680:523-1125(+)